MKKATDSYVEMCFHADEGQNLYLRIPTVWDVEIAQHYHASACLTTRERSTIWRKELGLKDG